MQVIIFEGKDPFWSIRPLLCGAARSSSLIIGLIKSCAFDILEPPYYTIDTYIHLHPSLPRPPSTPTASTPDRFLSGLYLPSDSLDRSLSHPIQRPPFHSSSFHCSFPIAPFLRHSLQYSTPVSPTLLSLIAHFRVLTPGIPPRLPRPLKNRHLIHTNLLQNLPLTRHGDDLLLPTTFPTLLIALQIANKHPFDPLPPRRFLGPLFRLHLCSFAVEDGSLVIVEGRAGLFGLDGFEDALVVEAVLFVVEGGAFAAVVEDHVGDGDASYDCCDDCGRDCR